MEIAHDNEMIFYESYQKRKAIYDHLWAILGDFKTFWRVYLYIDQQTSHIQRNHW